MSKDLEFSLSVNLNQFWELVSSAQIIFTQEFLLLIQNYQEQGLSDKVIYENIKDEFLSDGGKLSSLLNKQAYELWKMGKKVSQDTVFNGLGGDKYMWDYNPGAKHCKDCISRNGMVKTLGEWEKLGLPGAGNTQCHDNCMCDLVPVEKIDKNYYPILQAEDNK